MAARTRSSTASAVTVAFSAPTAIRRVSSAGSPANSSVPYADRFQHRGDGLGARRLERTVLGVVGG